MTMLASRASPVCYRALAARRICAQQYPVAPDAHTHSVHGGQRRRHHRARDGAAAAREARAGRS